MLTRGRRVWLHVHDTNHCESVTVWFTDCACFQVEVWKYGKSLGKPQSTRPELTLHMVLSFQHGLTQKTIPRVNSSQTVSCYIQPKHMQQSWSDATNVNVLA